MQVTLGGSVVEIRRLATLQSYRKLQSGAPKQSNCHSYAGTASIWTNEGSFRTNWTLLETLRAFRSMCLARLRRYSAWQPFRATVNFNQGHQNIQIATATRVLGRFGRTRGPFRLTGPSRSHCERADICGRLGCGDTALGDRSELP